MPYTVGKLLRSGAQWTLNYPARYLSKGIKSLYFDVANIKRYTVYWGLAKDLRKILFDACKNHKIMCFYQWSLFCDFHDYTLKMTDITCIKILFFSFFPFSKEDTPVILVYATVYH